jgi:hypothetical protein
MNADYNSLMRKWLGLVADHYELCCEAWERVDIPPLDIEEGTEHLRELIFYVQDTLAEQNEYDGGEE